MPKKKFISKSLLSSKQAKFLVKLYSAYPITRYHHYKLYLF